MDVDSVLMAARQAVIDEAFAALSAAHAEHYDAGGEQLTRQRLGELFTLVVEGVRERALAPVIEYAEQVATERFEAGFGIDEVQTAFNALEVAIWRRVVAAEPPEQLARSIGLVATVLGAGKDALARTYVSLASRRHVPSLDLSALFGGATA